MRIADIFAEEGSNAWYTREVEELLPQNTKCPECGSQKFNKENNILDVWFESGASHNVLGKREDLPWPSDLYVEGHDQYRGWFNSSLFVGVAAKDRSPYKTVITHGFVLDEQGRGMSKSLGNFIEPEEIISQHGAEILRLWVAMLNYKEDARFGNEILQRLIEAYRKIRNTWRFLLGNLYDFLPDKEMVAPQDMEPLERWILERSSAMGRRVLKAYEDFEFHMVFHTIYKLFTVELSAFYLDVLKDRLYCSGKTSKLRKSAQSALFLLLKWTLVLMAPVLPFTTEEAWEAMPGFKEKQESIHLELFPSFEEEWMASDIFEEWETLIDVRDQVLKVLEKSREEKLIGNSLEAAVTLEVPPSMQELLRLHEHQLPSLFIVSAVSLLPNTEEELKVKVQKAPGKKCQRCWNYSSYVGQSQEYPGFCRRCEDVVREMNP